MKFQVPEEVSCQQCGTAYKPVANLNEEMVPWQCAKCGELNYVFVPSMEFRIGLRLILAGENFLHANDPSLAAVLLYSAVDVTINRGIIELSNWRKIENLEAPPDLKTIKERDWETKLEKYEKLSGSTFDEEIGRLRKDQSYVKFLSGVSKDSLINEFRELAEQRHRVVHYGEDADEEIVRSSIPFVRRAVFVLEEMWEAAFKRPELTS